jgi:putative nucleotidyltransferase with HDIG domain
MELHGLRRNREEFPLELSLAAWKVPQGIFFSAIIRDITDRKEAEAALKASFEQLHRTLDGTVTALTNTIESRDPYTVGHQQRVAQLACAIAQELSFSEDRIEGMRVMGFLHDIGKIAVPAEILSKPGKLSEHEFNLIKVHCQVGYEILKEVDFPWPVAQAALQHHERMNGSGYPEGLKGEDMIPEARILAVADVVEAMASYRPYRPALGIEAALEEITKNKGILYDPEVVGACLKLFTEKGFGFEAQN